MTDLRLDWASQFLDALEPFGAFTFQTFDDSKRKRDHLVRIMHGTLTDLKDQLCDLNHRGAGIFVTVNKTDLKGRCASNITAIRAVFIDMDGKPLPQQWTVQPDIITQRSLINWHAYWIVTTKQQSLDEFPITQKHLAQFYKSDPKIHDLPRVMRVPGFLHKKNEQQPQLLELIKCQAPWTF
jgi:hypothetical protein